MSQGSQKFILVAIGFPERLVGTPKADGVRQHPVIGWQRLLTDSPWEVQEIQREIQAVFHEQVRPAAQTWSLGTVAVVDGSAFVKKGTKSVGVQRQYCGRLGKKENCQQGVFLVGVT